ncbi:hypothetical protein ACGFMM_11840 [Streptomyces sp. NPDC048604]|uniref:hypothetical protein n=1 Tax=Streptomyces sp. NPDC048604 TaxID=3365578 RepID=UPI003714890E
MSRSADRRDDEIRRLLGGAGHPAVPADLAERAVARGSRMLRRERLLRRAGWTLFALAVLAFVVWAAVARPWEPPPATTPPLEGW